MTIKTYSGKEFNASWAAVSSIGNNLNMALKENKTITEIAIVFSNAEETKEMEYIFDDITTIFTGYTKLTGINAQNGEIIVSLGKESQEADNADTD